MIRATCTVDNCQRTGYVEGLCRAHWRRLRDDGDVRAGDPIQPAPPEVPRRRLRKHGMVQVGHLIQPRPTDDPGRLICTTPGHRHDHLGACTICGVPTVAGLHPKARATLLRKRPDLAHLASAEVSA